MGGLTEHLNRLNHNYPKYQGSQCVHGVISVQEALYCGTDRSGIIICRSLWNAHRIHKGSTNEDCQENKQQRSDNLADTAYHLAWGNSQPPGEGKEHKGKDIQTNGLSLRPQQRSNRNFIRYSSCTRNSEEWSDGQIQQNGKRYAVPWRYAGSQILQIVTGITHCQYTGKRKTYTGNQKAESSPGYVNTCVLTHENRENQVACTEEQRKQH